MSNRRGTAIIIATIIIINIMLIKKKSVKSVKI